MHCPNCAQRASRDQKFCRSCGLNLEKVFELLGEHLPAAELRLREKQRRIDSWVKRIGAGLGGIIMIVVSTKLFSEISAEIENGTFNIWKWITIISIVAGVVALLSLVFYSASLNEKLKDRTASQPELSSDATSTKKLLSESHHISVPSITEHTTDLLEERQSTQWRPKRLSD